MSGEFRQMQRHSSDAEHLLRERLARHDLGDAAYERSVSQGDDRAFKVFGVVFIVGFAVVVLGLVWLAY